eukprot:TRINITY_DN16109_c0_g1_i1.p1 TRINITY_DN16109_c0_g1~~TRINITY_DN16109_c0_g1_i1.p1  ORF type:complete len:347 (+),score=63.00 TRINITY_DN16109_c0_g1_i1:78-1043(+)
MAPMPLWRSTRSGSPGLLGHRLSRVPSPTPRSSSQKPCNVRVVVVWPMTSDRLDISMEIGPRTTVQALKLQVGSRWRVPPSFQQLTFGSIRLAGSDPMAALLPSDGVTRTVVLSLVIDEVVGALEDSNSSMRCRAVEATSKVAVAKRGDDVFVSMLLKAGYDDDGDVRCAAVGGLAVLAEELADERALEALSNAVCDHHVGVRLSALRSLLRCAMPQSERHVKSTVSLPRLGFCVNDAVAAATAAVVSCLSDDDPVIRIVASEAVAIVSEMHSAGLVDMLEALLVHRDAMKRRVAAEVLEQLAVPSLHEETEKCGLALVAL